MGMLPFAPEKMQVALLRKSGDKEERAGGASTRFKRWIPRMRHCDMRKTLLGQDDPQLWQHLGADPERVFECRDRGTWILGCLDDAMALLSRAYPSPADNFSAEPGSVLPQHHPLVGLLSGVLQDENRESREEGAGGTHPDISRSTFSPAALLPTPVLKVRCARKSGGHDGAAAFGRALFWEMATQMKRLHCGNGGRSAEIEAPGSCTGCWGTL